MQSPGPMLVSASDSIKIWEAEHMSILKQYGSDNPTAMSSFKDVAWNVDNSKLAAVSNGNGIILYDIIEGAPKEIRKLPKSEEQTCVCFGRNKGEFYSGGATGDINRWNFSSCELEKTFESGHKSPVRRIHKTGDGRIASASTSGEIAIWHSDSCGPQMHLKAAKAKSIRGLGHSAWEKTILGTTSDDGVVCLWDIDKQVIKRSFSSHDAPSMDLSFSPMNHLLLSSCGLDKKIVFYDIHGNNVVKVITSTQPVTAVCMLSNGVHVCAGTSMGVIFKYDLRKTSEPLNSINAHSTSVQRLVLETLKERIRKDKRPSKSDAPISNQSKSSLGKDEPKAASQMLEKSGQKLRASQDIAKNRRSWSKVPQVELPSDVSKPLNGVDHVQTTPVTTVTNRKSQLEKSHGLQTPLNKSNMSSRRDTLGSYCEGIFSPVASVNESIQGDAYSKQGNGKPLRTSRGYTSQSALIPRASFNFNTPSNAKANEGAGGVQSDFFNGMETPDLGRVHSSKIQGRGSITESLPGAAAHSHSSTPTNTVLVPNSVSPQSPDNESTSTWKRLNSRNEEGSVHTIVNGNHMGEGASAGYQQTNFPHSNPFQYQLDFLQNTVRDLVEEHEDNIRDELRHLHMQIIKMFAQQNETIRQLAEQCSVNPLLLQEIERLRNENDRLRRKF